MAADSIPQLAMNPRIVPGCGTTISPVNYRGWGESYLFSNGIVEAIVVPAIGRVMQFRLIGDLVGTLWENEKLGGQLYPSAPGEWLNFGGDKCWPAPQADWPQHQGRTWPPPAAFDASPMQGIATRSSVLLTSPIDPAWGIQVYRHIELEPRAPVLRIHTEYHKVQGTPVKTGFWNITQMQEPERVCMLLNPRSRFSDGYVRLLDAEPADLRVDRRVLSLVRHRLAHTKIGADSSSLAWIGAACVVRIDVEPGPGEYPDGGCVTEVYTNPDPLHYVELETLGPLTTLSVGSSIEKNVTYTISARSNPDAQAEAQRVFRRK